MKGNGHEAIIPSVLVKFRRSGRAHLVVIAKKRMLATSFGLTKMRGAFDRRDWKPKQFIIFSLMDERDSTNMFRVDTKIAVL
jgi:hypothetical protein